MRSNDRACLVAGWMLAALTAACGSDVSLFGASAAEGGAGTTGSTGNPDGSGGSGQGGVGNGSSGPASGGASQCSTTEDCEQIECTFVQCLDAGCVYQPTPGNACNDGLVCTTGDTCDGSGQCFGAAMGCPPSPEPCLASYCDEAAGGCILFPANDGTACDDGDPCTSKSACAMGKCLAEDPVDCSSLDTQCTVGVCDAMLGCISEPTNDGAQCDDGLFCTTGETCGGGACFGGVPFSCAPPGGCAISSCDEATDSCVTSPGNDGAPCDDLDPCTSGSVCGMGLCAGGVPANEGQACDDGNPCTSGDACAAGDCVGATGPTVFLSEDFSDNTAGWTLGPEWQIGEAKVSLGGVWGSDPANDHTPTDDDGVAGIIIGGNASTVVHPPTMLVSPIFDTSTAPGPVILGFYRWLNSDYEPFMTNGIEVYDGTKWVLVWKSGASPIEDSPPQGQGWTYIQHDLTAYKNAAMRIRFGLAVGSSGAFTIGSWNLDDILVASAACP